LSDNEDSMKLRIKGNSLRLRITQTELAMLVESGSIEDTIYFAPAPDARLTYVLRVVAGGSDINLEYLPQRVTVMLSSEVVAHWATTDAVGIYGSADTSVGPLDLRVEKDFACLDGDDPVDEDAFPNPHAGSVC
jgi:hypothetical protein